MPVRRSREKLFLEQVGLGLATCQRYVETFERPIRDHDQRLFFGQADASD